VHLIDPPFLKLSVVERIEPIAHQRGVSEKARSGAGFLTAYKLNSGVASMLGREPTSNKTWHEVRRNFINRHEQQAIKLGEGFWDKTGEPTRRHLMLMIWAYTPTPNKTLGWLQNRVLRPPPRRSPVR
jgi:hypothetical protein